MQGKHGDHRQSDDQRHQRPRVGEVAVPTRLREAVDRRGKPRREQGEPDPVERVALRDPQLGHPAPGQRDGEGADRHVDEEDPPPAEIVDEHTADDRAEHRGE